MAIRLIRIHYVSYKLHYVPSSTVRTKRTAREPEQSEKLPFGYKSRRISHSSSHFLITMKNGQFGFPPPVLHLGFMDERMLLVEWLELASSDLFSSDTAGVGGLGLEYCFFVFAGLDWLTSISLPSESSSGGGGIRFWVAFFPFDTF